MIDKIMAFFEPEVVAQAPTHSIELATAVLLFEVIRADSETTQSERESFRQQLAKHITLADDELETLLAQGEAESYDAVDLVQFTSQLNAVFGAAEKAAVLESMWHIAVADGVIDMHEEHIIRRISDLLHIPHSQYIQAKLRVVEG